MRRSMWIKTASAVIISAFILMIFYPAVDAQTLSVREVEPIEGGIQYNTTKGKTRELGGGEFIKLDIGKSTTLIFIWGNRDIKAPITVVSKGVEIVGQMETRNGSKKPVTSEVITVYRLENLVEFEDANKNGLYDPRPRATNVDSENDRIIKTLSLSLAWSFQQRAPVRTKDGLEWTFVLEARNVSYSRTAASSVRPQVSADRGSAFVESIRFVFRLSVKSTREAKLVTDIEDINAVSLTADNRQISKYDLEKINVTTKMDHDINGWDFSNDNKKPALLLKFGLNMGRTFDLSLIKDISDPLKTKLYGDPSIGVQYSDLPRKTLWDEYRVKPLLKYLDTNGDGDIEMESGSSLLARYFWNDDLLEMNDQGGRSLRANLQFTNMSIIEPTDPVWKNGFFGGRTGIGLSVQGAYVYPRALNIHHDPGIQTFGWSVIEKEEKTGRDDDGHIIPGLLPFTPTEATVALALIVVIVLVAVAIISALTRRRLYPGDEELWKEEEEEVFVAKTKKRDWDKLRPK